MRRLLSAAPVALAFAAYGLIALIVTYPLVTTLDTRLIGHPFGDATEYVSHIWWIKHALQTGQDPFYQGLLLYPRGLPATWLWSLPLQSFPAWLLAFVVPLPAAFNVSALLTLALNGTAMFWLAQRLITTENTENTEKTSRAAAFVAGIVFMLYPTMQGHLGAAHTGLLALWGVPLWLGALLRLRDGRRFIVIGAALFPVALGGSPLTLIYVVAPLVTVYLLALIARRDGALVRRTLITLLLGGLCAAPLLVPVVRESGGYSQADGVVRYSAALLGIISPSFEHPLFAGLDYPRRVLGVDPFEGAAYVGAITAGLALLALIRVRQSRWWGVAALAAWMLSLGALLKLDDAPLTAHIGGYATTIPLPGTLLQFIPLLNIARTPGRFNFAVGLAAAVMAGYGAGALARHIKRAGMRVPVLIGLCALIAFEYQFFFPVPSVDASIPAPIQALAGRDDVRAVFNIPFDHPLVDKEGMYLQTAHQQPMIAGHINRQTPLDPARGWLLQSFDPALLDMAGADVVILHRAWDDPMLESAAYARLGAPIYEDARYAAFEVAPHTGTPPAFTWVSRVGAAVSESADVYFYAPAAGEVVLHGRVSADGRGAVLRLDGDVLVAWTVTGEQGWNVPITFRAPGFHTLTLSVEPACAPPADPTLVCRPLTVHQLELRDYRPFRTP